MNVWNCAACNTSHSDVKRYLYFYSTKSQVVYTCCKPLLRMKSVLRIRGCFVCKQPYNIRFTGVCEDYVANLQAYIFTCSAYCLRRCKRMVTKHTKLVTECVNCHQAFENIKKCSKCKIAYYCSSDCQRADWPKHKTLCASLTS